jgi:hypothetical protein
MNTKDDDKRCPFCNCQPVHVKDVYPHTNADKDLVSCPNVSEAAVDCPASGTWVTRERWNDRTGPENVALLALRDFVEPDLQQDERDSAVIVWLVMNYIDGLRGMLSVDAEEIARLSDLLEASIP